MMLLAVFERAALMLMTLFLLTRTHLFQAIVIKRHRRPFETSIISLLFIFFAVGSTYTGLKVSGSLVNVRIIAILSGGILFGPWVGIPAGLVSGIHRYLIDIHGPTSVACLITSILAGVLATWIHIRCPKKQYANWGIAAGMFCEVITMTLILLLNDDVALAKSIVQEIGLPMIFGAVCIGLIIILVQDLDEEKDKVAAIQAKLALNIANKTLPHFRKSDRDSLTKVCAIIRQETEADAVAITDTQDVKAYVGIGQENFLDAHHKISYMTQQAVNLGKQIISNDLNVHEFHSLLIIPLWENGQVTGTLKIFYCQPHRIRQALREMAIGLSQLISTQIEVSKIDQLKTMASKAEFSALQNKINPHFLFNALNAISTLVRIKPDKARQLIANLADFLRFNLEKGDDLIDIQEELQQVRDYVAIEQARFGNKLEVIFDIDAVNFSIPPLLIQPLVENAIQHGVVPLGAPAQVIISVKKQEDGQSAKVMIKDTGVGVRQEIINKVYQGTMDSHRIGLVNVHQRVALLYGEGLTIQRLHPGTEISFYVNNIG
ncbi:MULTISPECIES: LytS/YhcK type 5TM receptor domain-containing protein [Vibrio]|uniref:Sensor histidine kinase n=2 Tax=Vibrio TaxID=662 RepID=A0A7X4LJI9_9VIBR|nr:MULTISPECIES: LytS/YhcK type 5TM receptor domain-containing protein [Vibrio]MBF9002849.1 histidine kinase [Vibrio nitrifigilis]MZI92930.1 sensor histidine kinase [Vibrio eleionomae]